MALTPDQAARQARELYDYHTSERDKLDRIRRYWKGRQRLPEVIPSSAPREVLVMARLARVNVCDIVVESLAQSLYVDGFRTVEFDDTTGDPDDVDAAVWDGWQRNKLDRGQSRTHRPAAAYGTGYAIVTPGNWSGRTMPLITPRSPRKILAMFGEDPDWPEYALERPRSRGGPWRLYDDGYVHSLWLQNAPGGTEFARRPDSTARHMMDRCPVVRFSDVEDDDLDDEPAAEHGRVLGAVDGIVAGQVAPMIPLQDQIDVVTFNLMVAQHYSAFRQRYILGWVAESEAERIKVSAAQWLTFEDSPDEVKIGELQESNLEGYIKSREASLRHAATLSQTPVHELIGELINLSAEALAAAEAGKDRKVDERKTGFGESWESVFQLVGQLTAVEVPDDAEVVWRDTSARSFAAIVDGLGKLAQMLEIPPEELWERVPGATQQDVRRWKQARREVDGFASLTRSLDAQAGLDAAGGDMSGQITATGLVLPAGVG